MDYLQIANSWPVWLCAGACVAFIVVQAVAFAKLCYKNAPLVGLSKADCSKSFQCGMVTAIGPSLSCFIGAISMITVVGGPLAWMRLSMIGAAPTVKRSAAAMKSGWALSPAPLPLVCSATWLLSTTIKSLSIPLRLGPASPAPLAWSPASSSARRCPGSRNTALALPS